MTETPREGARWGVPTDIQGLAPERPYGNTRGARQATGVAPKGISMSSRS